MLKSEVSWYVVCDSCGELCEYGEFTSFGDKGVAVEHAVDEGWSTNSSYRRQHCPGCPPLCGCGNEAVEDEDEGCEFCADCMAKRNSRRANGDR